MLQNRWPAWAGIRNLTKIEDIPPNGPDVLPLTKLLEQTRGSHIELTTETWAEHRCLVDKATLLGVSVITTAGKRTIAYQKHLREIWDKMIEHNNLKDDPPHFLACEAKRNLIIAEKGSNVSGNYDGNCPPTSHCIRRPPAFESSRHLTASAFDVSKETIKSLRDKLALRTPPQTISGLLAEPTACKLTWGQVFSDPIHFDYTP